MCMYTYTAVHVWKYKISKTETTHGTGYRLLWTSTDARYFWGEGYFGTAVWAPPIRGFTTGCRAVLALDIWVPFPNLFLFFELWRKNNKAGDFLNAVEREPVETRVLKPTASEVSYKPKQRSYRTTNLKKKVLAPNSPGAELPSAET